VGGAERAVCRTGQRSRSRRPSVRFAREGREVASPYVVGGSSSSSLQSREIGVLPCDPAGPGVPRATEWSARPAPGDGWTAGSRAARWSGGRGRRRWAVPVSTSPTAVGRARYGLERACGSAERRGAPVSWGQAAGARLPAPSDGILDAPDDGRVRRVLVVKAAGRRSIGRAATRRAWLRTGCAVRSGSWSERDLPLDGAAIPRPRVPEPYPDARGASLIGTAPSLSVAPVGCGDPSSPDDDRGGGLRRDQGRRPGPPAAGKLGRSTWNEGEGPCNPRFHVEPPGRLGGG
jgi:hypothetical protein